MNLSYKSQGTKIEDVDVKQGVITIYGSAFGMPDSDGDIITKGAYIKTLQENGPQAKNRIWFLENHDTSKFVAKPTEIKEDNYGLLAVIKMPDTSRAKDLLALYEAGHITEHSVGFMPIKQQKKGEWNEITEIKLYEISAVPWGANEFTPTVSVKSEMKATDIVELLNKAYAEHHKTAKSMRDWKGEKDTYELLEIKIKQLDHQIETLEKSVAEKIAAESTMNQQPDMSDIEIKLLLNSLETKYNNMKKSE